MPNLPNLSGSNIQDTYQRVLHTDGTLIYNGTGSVISNMPTTASFAVTASHALEAVVEITKEVSSSYADTASFVDVSGINGVLPFANGGTGQTFFPNGSVVGSNGSNLISIDMSTKGILLVGDGIGQPAAMTVGSNNTILTADSSAATGLSYKNTLNILNITASGDISSSNNLFAKQLYVEDQLAVDYSDGIAIGNATDPIRLINHVTASGNISASGGVYANGIFNDGRIYPNAPLSTNHFLRSTTATNPIIQAAGGFNVTGALTASGNVSSSGTVIADNLSVDHAILFGPTNRRIIYSGNDDNIVVQDSSLKVNSDITASGDISSSGDILGGNIRSHGKIAALHHIGSSTIRLGSGESGMKTRVYGENIWLDAPVTASGNISASGNLIGDDLQLGGEVGLLSDTNLLTIGNTLGGELNTVYFKTAGVGIGTNTPTSKLTVGGTFNATGDITGSGDMKLTGMLDIGGGISSSGQTPNYLKERRFDSTVPINNGTNMFYDGDTIRHGTGPSGDNANIVAGKVYYLSTSDQWEEADSGASATSTGLLGLAVRDEMNTFLIRGFMAHSSFGAGASAGIGGPIYLGSSAAITGTAPTSGYVRVLGYKMNVSDRRIYFNPDNTWVELT